MTLDEAIAHCKEIAEELGDCSKCAKEHIQLAAWLEELKALRQQECRHHWIVDRSIVLTSYPPQFRCRCSKCGEHDTKTNAELRQEIENGCTIEDDYDSQFQMIMRETYEKSQIPC